MSWLLGRNAQVKIEVEPTQVLLVMDRPCDHFICPWEDAFRLAETMELVIKEGWPTRNADSAVILREQSQIRLAHHKGLVALVMDWTDRVRYTSQGAFFLTSRALRKAAQDSNLERRGVIFCYDRQGMIAKVHTLKTQITQHIR